MKTGDLVKYRRIDVAASFKADHRSGVWVEEVGIVLSARGFRPARPDKDYLVNVYFPTFPGSASSNYIRTLRASKIDEVL
tara:strand:- start:177 stop:416 length:240 start_codon:yes stop_codon:yes gene_type:complete